MEPFVSLITRLEDFLDKADAKARYFAFSGALLSLTLAKPQADWASDAIKVTKVVLDVAHSLPGGGLVGPICVAVE